MLEPILFPLTFLAGIVSFLGPCHLLMIPTFLSYILANENISTKRGFLSGVAYTFGLTLTFSVYNFILQLLPESIYYLPIFRFLTGLIIVILATALLVGFDFGTSHFSKSKSFDYLVRNFNLIGLVLFGALAGLAWIPCLTPALALILTTISISHDFLGGYILLLLYALGLGSPFILLGMLGLQIKESVLARWVIIGNYVQKTLAIVLELLGILIILDSINLWMIFSSV